MCEGVVGDRVCGVVELPAGMTPLGIWGGGSSISGGTGRLLATEGNGEECEELGAVFSVLPEGELELELERPNLEGV